MALRLEILKVNTFASKTATTETASTFAITTDTTTYDCYLKGKDNKVNCYVVSFLNIGFQKKMYQPTEIDIAIQFMPYKSGTTIEKWVSITKSVIEALFTNKQVKLFDLNGATKNTDGTYTVPDDNYIGEDYYVFKAIPCYYSDSMIVKLTICSPDKQMTLEQNCRAFVSKKLNSEILSTEVAKFYLPYDSSSKLASKANMKVLAYTRDGKDTEHIFPYLVQYNESIYDMLARTANRWGEFMFYEDKALHLGYNETTTKTVSTYSKFTYINIENAETIGDDYDNAANYDKNISNNPLKKSPNSVSGFMLKPGNKADVAFMREVATFLKNEKNIPTYLTNELIDTTLAVVKKSISVTHDNRNFNNDYFSDDNKKKEPEKYGSYAFDAKKPDKKKDGFNPFSEINSKYDNDKYSEILKAEKAAAIDAVCIDFNTTYPKLKLGQIITLSDDSNEYIVVQIDCDSQNMLNLKDNIWIDQSNSKPDPTFQVIAVAKQAKDKKFYPTVLPTGHVRYAEPQTALVADEEDPAEDAGRVRVVFPWQMGSKTEVDDELVEVSTPWLQYSANASGQKGIMGKHYKNDKVFVGFLAGNVERPYVIGGLSKGAKTDVECTTPGGHTFKLEDDYGMLNFFKGMLSPLAGTVTSFIPYFTDLKEKVDFKGGKYLGGGFQLTDRYGIYKISGSTDERSINIASPWGEVKMNAFTGITISAPNGDISIKGKNISIQAGNNLELVSGKNVKNKILGGNASGFFSDMGYALERRLVQAGLSAIDLSIIRTVFEIVFRPAEGKLLVKSNRYLMLESGKGECLYPEGAYKNKETFTKKLVDDASKDVRKGLKLSSAVQEMVDKINVVGDKIDSDYRTTYNTCVNKCNSFKDLINKQERQEWCNGYQNKVLKVCKDYDALKTDLWKNGTDLLKEDDLGFEAAISNKNADVDGDVVTRFKQKNPNIVNGLNDDKVKEKIVEERNTYRTEILEAVNALRKAIIDFTAITELGDDYISGAIGAYQQKVTDELKKSIITAFNKNKLGDSFFVQKIEDDAKKLENAYANNDALIDQRKKLKRKAATTMLEEMGFKDDWRGKYIIPGNPPQSENVPRKFDEKDLNDDYWTKYVATIQNVPDLSAAELTALQKILKDVIDQLLEKKKEVMFWKWNSENSSWGDAKNGEILFSSDANVYHFEKQNITEVPSKFRERLNGADGVTEDATVSTFLTDLRDKLNGLN